MIDTVLPDSRGILDKATAAIDTLVGKIIRPFGVYSRKWYSSDKEELSGWQAPSSIQICTLLYQISFIHPEMLTNKDGIQEFLNTYTEASALSSSTLFRRIVELNHVCTN